MFVVLLTYTADLAKVDAALPEHVTFLEKNYSKGLFLASGRKVPRTGGVILARGQSKEALEAILAEDPFVTRGLAEYEVIEFVPTRTATGLEILGEKPRG